MLLGQNWIVDKGFTPGQNHMCARLNELRSPGLTIVLHNMALPLVSGVPQDGLALFDMGWIDHSIKCRLH